MVFVRSHGASRRMSLPTGPCRSASGCSLCNCRARNCRTGQCPRPRRTTPTCVPLGVRIRKRKPKPSAWRCSRTSRPRREPIRRRPPSWAVRISTWPDGRAGPRRTTIARKRFFDARCCSTRAIRLPAGNWPGTLPSADVQRSRSSFYRTVWSRTHAFRETTMSLATSCVMPDSWKRPWKVTGARRNWIAVSRTGRDSGSDHQVAHLDR